MQNRHSNIKIGLTSPKRQPQPLSPLKYLLQNNIKLNQNIRSNRTQQEIIIISHLISSSSLFTQFSIDLTEQRIRRQICSELILIYCESPHIMETKQNQIYFFLQGQGFEYMQNNYDEHQSKKFKLYDNNEYIMLRKISANQYFLSYQENHNKYHSNIKKYQLMVDQNTLLGKVSADIFNKIFQQRISQKLKEIVTSLKKVSIFNGLPTNFYFQLSKFVTCFELKANQKILSRQEKSKFLYVLKKGAVQLRFPNDKLQKNKVTSNYMLANSKQIQTYKIGQLQAFGMDDLQAQQNLDRQVITLTDCLLYKLDKRLLAIIITSFQLQFQQKNKVWSQININNQIKGQSHTSPQKELLIKNAERIRTSQRKIRDLKLRYLSTGKQKRGVNGINEDDSDLIQQNQSAQLRRASKTNQNRKRSSLMKFYNNGTNLSKEDYFRHMLEMNSNELKSNKRVSHIEYRIANDEAEVQSPKLRMSNTFEYREKIESMKLTRSLSKFEGYETKKFVPKIQSKNSFFMSDYKNKMNNDMIGVFLDKKIKNQIVKKAQKILNMNKNSKFAQNKYLKRLFTLKEPKGVNAMSEQDKKNIAEDIAERMTNIQENPLLLQIQNERKKVQRNLRLLERKSNSVKQPVKRKYKKEDELILIRNHRDQ